MRLALVLLGLITALGATSAAAMPHYDVKAVIDPQAGRLHGEVTITAPDAGPAPTFVLGSSFTIREASAGPGDSVAIGPTDQPFPGLWKLTVTRSPKAKGPLRLKVVYDGPPNPAGDPPINLVTPSLTELGLDSMWLPLSADFALFSVDAAIEGLPADAVPVAGGEVRRDGQRVLIHRASGDVDLAFAAARFQTAKVGDVEIYAENLDGERAVAYRGQAAPALAFLTNWFGPMPGAPVRIAIVSRPRVSGYSRPGYIVVTEGAPAPPANSAKFLAHEFSHAWWRRAVFTGEDHWLNESTAEYVSLRYVEQAFGRDKLDEMLARKRQAAAKAGPILGHGRAGDDELYSKGPVLLFDLERQIGRDKLDALLKAQALTPANTTRGFLDALAAAAGPDVARDFEAKLRA